MKRNLIIILILFFANSTFSQNRDSIKAMADSAIKKFTWKIRKSEKTDTIYLDISFQRENQDKIENLRLSVSKDKSKDRPSFITVEIPNNVVQNNGIFIKFAKTIKINKNPGWKLELEKGNPNRINFEKCSSEKQTCIARIIDGYLIDEETKEKVDIFQKFFDFDHVLFLFIYPDGTHKSVSIPLFSFKQQYKTL